MKNSLLLSLALMTAMPVAAAKLSMPSDAPKSYEAECASCHMAYQPGLLGQKIGSTSWPILVSTLAQMRALMTKHKVKLANG